MQVIQSVKFKYETSDDVKSLLTTFRDMINFCIEKALQHKVTSFMKLRALIYDEFKERFKGYNTQYCYSAVRIACNILKSWRRRGKEPRAKKLFSRFVSTLTKFEGEKLRISFKPRKFITLKLICGEYQKKFIEAWRKGECRIGEIILNENFVIIPFIKEVDLTNPNESIAIDINESNVTAVDSKGNSFVIDLSEVKRIRYCYFQKRRNIQKRLANKPVLMKKVMVKYSGRERRRVEAILHKASKIIVELAKNKKIIMESLKNIRKAVNKKVKAYNRISKKIQLISTRGKNIKRRLNSWNFRKFQFYIDYKAKLNGCPVIYVNPMNTSKVCFRCGGIINSTDKACPRCGIDRHVNACLNMLKTQDVRSLGSLESPLMMPVKLG